MANLFDPLKIRDLTLPNRIVVSPMCEYSSRDGFANDWHLVHLGSRAVGGAALVMTEAAAVTSEGRISPDDLGIWKDQHIEFLSRITSFIHSQGSIAGVQLAHAGRKASTYAPGVGRGAAPLEVGGWEEVLAPSSIPFANNYLTPKAMTLKDIAAVSQAFADAALRALHAGFRVIEIHAAHGYLISEFLSPLANHRNDEYGGSLANRMRLVLEIASSVRRSWPERFPMFVRISATDWVEGGWTPDDSVELARHLKDRGVDLVDCSSGGNVVSAPIPAGPGYQTLFAERVRREANIPSGAVGMITSPAQADHIIRTGQADLVFIAREFLRDPYWPLRAARDLGYPVTWPIQYLRAAPAGAKAREKI
jgi:2,4-dienoyl-CoA reductase-like NADH-dependent reductase (Old Yellow Enzyme family)